MAAVIAEIILVEDNAHDAELALYTLSKGGFAPKIEVLRDGAEALDYFFATGRFSSQGIPDLPRLILLDLKLPKVDGIEVLRRVKSDRRLRPTPVVMLTSSREERDIEESYRLGANSYVVKPVDYDQFALALQSISAYWVRLNERSRAAGDDEPREGTP
jgi:two-component system, response regulator